MIFLVTLVWVFAGQSGRNLINGNVGVECILIAFSFPICGRTNTAVKRRACVRGSILGARAPSTRKISNKNRRNKLYSVMGILLIGHFAFSFIGKSDQFHQNTEIFCLLCKLKHLYDNLVLIASKYTVSPPAIITFTHAQMWDHCVEQATL